VNPPNIPRSEYFRGAEQAYLHSSPDFKRDLSYLKQRWVFYQAANRGHIPTLVVRSKKGPKTVKITNWVEYVLYHAKQVDDQPISLPNSTIFGVMQSLIQYSIQQSAIFETLSNKKIWGLCVLHQWTMLKEYLLWRTLLIKARSSQLRILALELPSTIICILYSVF
jgi:hypothetical protein